MRTASIALAAVIVLYSSQAPAQAQWTEEVTNFRGIEIGTKLTDIPECPKRPNALLRDRYYDYYSDDSAKDYPEEFKGKVCWKIPQDPPLIRGGKSVVLSNLSFIKGAGREAVVSIVDGSIEAIDVRFLSHYATEFREAFIEKYGSPSKRTVRQYQNSLGATYDGLSLSWYGQKVTLTFDEISGSLEWGLMAMRSHRFDHALRQQQEGAKANVKSRL